MWPRQRWDDWKLWCCHLQLLHLLQSQGGELADLRMSHQLRRTHQLRGEMHGRSAALWWRCALPLEKKIQGEGNHWQPLSRCTLLAVSSRGGCVHCGVWVAEVSLKWWDQSALFQKMWAMLSSKMPAACSEIPWLKHVDAQLFRNPQPLLSVSYLTMPLNVQTYDDLDTWIWLSKCIPMEGFNKSATKRKSNNHGNLG